MSVKIATFPFITLRNVGNPGLSRSGESRLFYNSATSTLQVSNNGSEYSDVGVTDGYVDGYGSGASRTLSNLASVSINTDLLPDSNSTRSIGSHANRWKDGYFSSLDLDGYMNLDGYLHLEGDLTLDGYGAIYNYNIPINVQTGTTYTLLSSDSGKTLTLDNGSAITVDIPAALPLGFNVRVVQIGAGQVTFVPAAGVTLNNRQSHTKTAGQYAVVSLVKHAAELFVLSGDSGA